MPLNYRSKLWNYTNEREKIMTELVSYCDIILGNEEDSEMHFGIKPDGLNVVKEGDKVNADKFLSVCQQRKTIHGQPYPLCRLLPLRLLYSSFYRV